MSHTVTVVDNTTAAAVLSCVITAGNTFCQNTGTAAVIAGHYRQVRINGSASASNNRAYRVTFRY